MIVFIELSNPWLIHIISSPNPTVIIANRIACSNLILAKKKKDLLVSLLNRLHLPVLAFPSATDMDFVYTSLSAQILIFPRIKTLIVRSISFVFCLCVGMGITLIFISMKQENVYKIRMNKMSIKRFSVFFFVDKLNTRKKANMSRIERISVRFGIKGEFALFILDGPKWFNNRRSLFFSNRVAADKIQKASMQQWQMVLLTFVE